MLFRIRPIQLLMRFEDDEFAIVDMVVANESLEVPQEPIEQEGPSSEEPNFAITSHQVEIVVAGQNNDAFAGGLNQSQMEAANEVTSTFQSVIPAEAHQVVLPEVYQVVLPEAVETAAPQAQVVEPHLYDVSSGSELEMSDADYEHINEFFEERNITEIPPAAYGSGYQSILNDPVSIASLGYEPALPAIQKLGDSVFKVEEGLGAGQSVGFEMEMVSIPGMRHVPRADKIAVSFDVDIGAAEEHVQLLRDNNVKAWVDHNEKMEDDIQYRTEFNHARAETGFAPITKEFYEFADDILKKNGVEQGIENPNVTRMLAYDEDRGLMVKMGTVLTGPIHDAFDRWKYPPEGPDLLGKVLDVAPAIIIGVITAGVGAAIAAEVMVASTAATSAAAAGAAAETSAMASVGSFATEIGVSQAGLGNVISAGLQGAINGNFDPTSLVIAAYAPGAQSGLTQGLASATQMSGAVASAISSSVVSAGVQAIRTGEVDLEQMVANAAQGAALNSIESGITGQVGQEYQNLVHFGVQSAAELATGANLENVLIHQAGGTLIAAAAGNPNKIPIGKASGEEP